MVSTRRQASVEPPVQEAVKATPKLRARRGSISLIEVDKEEGLLNGQTPAAAASAASQQVILPTVQEEEPAVRAQPDDQPLVPRSPQPSSGDETNSDSSNEESDDDAILGTGPLSQLADSLRAALQARMGSIGTQNNAPAPGGATSSKQEAPENDPAAKLEWRHAVASPKQKQLPKAGHHMGISIDREEGLAKQLMVPPRDPHITAKAAAKAQPDTAGKAWYNLPATKITDEVKLQLRLLRLRGAYDPKRFYKSADDTKFPKYFQVGTVVDSPTDFYGGRLSNQQRGADMAEELLNDTSITRTRKRRYNKLQEQAHKYQRVKKRKTDKPRTIQKKQRPKH